MAEVRNDKSKVIFLYRVRFEKKVLSIPILLILRSHHAESFSKNFTENFYFSLPQKSH